jgi:hypothetical protein
MWRELAVVLPFRGCVGFCCGARVPCGRQVFEGSAPPGFVRVSDLVRDLKTYCSEKLTEQQIKELLAQLETDADGLVNYADYVSLMMT